MNKPSRPRSGRSRATRAWRRRRRRDEGAELQLLSTGQGAPADGFRLHLLMGYSSTHKSELAHTTDGTPFYRLQGFEHIGGVESPPERCYTRGVRVASPPLRRLARVFVGATRPIGSLAAAPCWARAQRRLEARAFEGVSAWTVVNVLALSDRRLVGARDIPRALVVPLASDPARVDLRAGLPPDLPPLL